MDLLRSCTSGVHIVDCFSSIAFQVFGIDKGVESSKRTCAARWALLETEYNARKTGLLVTTDLMKLQLWIFEIPKSSALAASASPGAVQSFTHLFEPLPESELRSIHRGDFCLSDVQAAFSASKPNDDENFSVVEIYRSFVRSCLRALSFQLAAEQNIIPLNTHSFVVCPPRVIGSDTISASYTSIRGLYHIISFKFDLVEQGYLQIAATYSFRHDIQCLANSRREERKVDELEYPPLIFVAPSSRLARKNWRNELLAKLERPKSSNAKSYQPAEWVFSEPQGRIWKSIVLQWLRWQGLDLHDHQSDDDWVQLTVFLRFPHGEDATPRNRLLTDRLTLPWPAQLCFKQGVYSHKDNSTLRIVASGYEVRNGTEWFQYGSRQGFPDPLQAAISWMENKSALDSELESRKARIGTETTDPASQDVTVDMFDAQSPLDGRTMSYSEPQGIYPTPSDGLPAHVTPGSTSFENSVFPSLGQLDAASSPDFETRDLDNKDAPSLGISNDISDQPYGGEDHYFGSTALTDADFDFFDQPTLNSTDAQPEAIDIDEQNDNIAADDDGPTNHDANNAQREDESNTTTESHTIAALQENQQSEHISDGIVPRIEESKVNIDQTSIEMNPTDIQTGNSKQDESLMSESQNDAAIDTPKNGSSPPHNTKSAVSLGTIPKFDDHKYLGDGRFGFQPRKRLKRTSTSQSMAKDSKRHPNGFASRVLPTRVDSATSVKQFQYSKDSTDDETSSDDESALSESNIGKSLSRKHPNNTSEDPGSKLPSLDSDSDIPRNRPEPALSGPSGNQKLWSIEGFDALVATMLMGYFKSSSTNGTLTHFLAIDQAEPYLEPNDRRQQVQEEIGIAQILADQISRCIPSLRLFGGLPEHSGAIEPPDDSNNLILSYANEAISNVFSQNTTKRQDLLHFMSPVEQGDDDEPEVELLRIPPAQVRLQRSRTEWDFASSSPAFWETLGLEPAHGPKQVTAFCVYPWSLEIEASIDNFLETMESTWMSQKLGSHRAGDAIGDDRSGHAPVRADGSGSEKISTKDALLAFSNTCGALGQSLKATRDLEARHVIYIINPFESTAAFEALCASFWTLRKAYNADDDSQSLPKISLQIVPIKLIASVEAPVFIEPETANLFAHRVYDNCLPTGAALDRSDLPIPSSASIILSKPVPESIRFQFSASPSSNVLEEYSSMHVAYSESPNRRWVAVTWTDDTGEYQHSACYHLAGLGISGSVVKEMWETTLEIIKPRRVNWRLFVVKCGFFNPHEHKMWQNIAAHSSGSSYRLSLVCVNTSPALAIGIKPSIKVALMEAPAPTANTYTTPASTPHPQQPGSSPAAASPTAAAAAAAAASTPSAFPAADQAAATEADQTARLIDKTDESWGIVLSQRRNVSESAVDYHPALASGFLMKRTGPGELDVPVLLEVNLVQSQELAGGGDAANADDSAWGPLLREVLVMYRNLGLLARLRGLEGRDSCTPWHVAVATKAAEGLGRCMSW